MSTQQKYLAPWRVVLLPLGIRANSGKNNHIHWYRKKRAHYRSHILQQQLAFYRAHSARRLGVPSWGKKRTLVPVHTKESLAVMAIRYIIEGIKYNRTQMIILSSRSSYTHLHCSTSIRHDSSVCFLNETRNAQITYLFHQQQ